MLENNELLLNNELDYVSEMAKLILNSIENELIIDDYVSKESTIFSTLENVKDAIDNF